jgi:hypothetical protein
MRGIAISALLAAAWLAGETLVAADGPKAPTPCTQVQTCGSEGCCAHCGCRCPCLKYCCIQPTIREIKKIVWVCHCEDFCAPLPGCKHGCCQENGEDVGAEPCCRRCDPCAVEENKCQVPPKCGKVRERKTLERKEIICKVPTYKCIVVYCCPKCQHAVECGDRPATPVTGPSPKLPPPPLPSGASPTQPRVPPLPPPPLPGKTTRSVPLSPAGESSTR